MARDRKSRPEPQRPGYKRTYSTSFRDADSWDWPGAAPGNGGNGSSGGAESNGGQGPGWSDVVGDGVAMGYRVIEEQIRQGQKVAEEIGGRFTQPGGGGFDPQDIQQRMWRSYWDLASLWWDYMGSLTRSQPFQTGFGEPQGGAWAPQPEGEPQPLSIAVDAERVSSVGLVLNGATPGRTLVALKLLRGDEAFRGEVSFASIEPGEPIRVTVEVPEDQPAGDYSGLVVDGSTGARLGTLTIRIEDR